MILSTCFKRSICSIVCLVLLMISFVLIPTVAHAENKVSLKVEAVSAEPGAEIKVPITIESNSGIASLKFMVKYDDTVITLKDVSFAKKSGTYSSVPEPYSANQTINFVSPLSLYANTGTIATLTFLVNEEAALNSNAVISIEFDEDDIFDMVFNNVPLVSSNGSVQIGNKSQGTMAVLPITMTIIEEEALMNTSFYYVVLPEGTTTIESKAFANCYNLRYIYIPTKTTQIAEDAFQDVISLTIYGKKGSYAETFANKHGFVFKEQ